MKNSTITLVTAFFPIQREIWGGCFARSDDKYFQYFEFWARIQNDLVVYTVPEFKDRILDIRHKFGRDNTIVITIEDPFLIDQELYESIKKASQNQLARDFRLLPQNPESWNAEYDYLMLLKEWCVQDAVQKELTSKTAAWIDFGFNHGGDYYLKAEEFDFCWQFDFSDKIHLFEIDSDDGLPIFEAVRRMNTYIQGDLIVASAGLWNKLWELIRQKMLALNEIGLIDDDQILLTMIAREHPELCELHQSSWFSQIQDFSDQTFSVRASQPHDDLWSKFRSRLSHERLIRRYQHKWTKILKQSKTKD